MTGRHVRPTLRQREDTRTDRRMDLHDRQTERQTGSLTAWEGMDKQARGWEGDRETKMQRRMHSQNTR
jgi:hypothetical protein